MELRRYKVANVLRRTRVPDQVAELSLAVTIEVPLEWWAERRRDRHFFVEVGRILDADGQPASPSAPPAFGGANGPKVSKGR